MADNKKGDRVTITITPMIRAGIESLCLGRAISEAAVCRVLLATALSLGDREDIVERLIRGRVYGDRLQSLGAKL